MKACVVTKAGGPDVLRMVDRSEPAPDAGEAVVSLVAANVNPTDLGAREGMVPLCGQRGRRGKIVLIP